MLVIRKLNNLLYSKQYYNSYFNRCSNKYKKVESYIMLYNRLFESRAIVKTTKTITHTSKITFGTSLNKAKRLIIEPYRFVRNSETCDIIFYTKKIGKHKIIIELHFFKSKLVFFKQTFPTTIDPVTINHNIKNKYFPSENTLFNLKSNLIMDAKKSFLKVENDVSLSVYYFNLNQSFYPFLLEKQKLQKQKSIQQKQLELDKLFHQL
ncbi:conserved protein of unknown function [Tenacibaculum sp. 190130A14a]|uniref:Uncharacterized protein n=1 Tax=Tenacibaculum polynesiense TaxID=3137857 RepID=A0ABM9PAZ0_9FLAO